MVKNKVFMLSCGYDSSNGVATVTRELTQALNQRRDFEVDVLTYWPWDEQKDALFEYISPKGVKKKYPSLDSFVNSSEGRQNYDLIQFHNNIFADNVLTMAPQNTLSLQEFLDNYDAATVSLTHSLAQREGNETHIAAQEQIMELSDILVHLTQEQRERAKEHHPEEDVKTMVIGNGTFLPTNFSQEEINNYRQTIARDEQVIGLYLGRLSEEKGILELAVSLKEIKQEHPEFKLIIAGNKEGDLESTVRPFLEQNGLIDGEDYQFLGWISDRTEKEKLIASANYTIMPSYYEHFPMAALETMVRGTPLIITDIEGPRSIFQLQDKNNRLALPISQTKDPWAITQAVNYALEHPAEMQAIAKRGEKEVKEKYTWEKIAEQYASLFTRAIRNKKGKKSGSSFPLKVGVVVPTYNRKDMIQQNLDALLNQDFQEDYKIVVVDDGSTDGTFEHVLDIYQDQIMSIENEFTGESRIVNPEGKLLVVRQKNKHVSAARNTGFKKLYELGCQYFTHQDSDDIALPHKLKSLTHYLDNNQTVGLVHAKSHTITKEGFFLEPQESPWERYYGSAWWDFNEDGETESMWEMAQTEQWKPGDIDKQHYIHNHTPMYRRNAIEKLGLDNLYDENQHFAEDWDFHKKLERAGVQFSFIDDYVAISRYHDIGLTGTENNKKSPSELILSAQQAINLEEKAKLYTLARERAGVQNVMELHQHCNQENWEESWNELWNDLWDVKFNLAFERNFAVNCGDPVKAYHYATLLSNLEPSTENKQRTVEVKESLNFKYIFERDFHLRLCYLPEATQYAKKAYALAPTTENREILTELLRL